MPFLNALWKLNILSKLCYRNKIDASVRNLVCVTPARLSPLLPRPAGEVGEVKEEKPEQPSRPVEKGARRGDFTRQEYERRHQLKIMEDLDKVLRQKPTTVRGVKKQRPKTVFRDDSVLSRSPVKGYLGNALHACQLCGSNYPVYNFLQSKHSKVQ